MGAARDLGPLDWRTPIVDGAGRPSPEFQRRWNTQRQNNGLIGGATLGSGAPTGTPQDGAEYVDVAATPPALYVGSGGSWRKVGVFSFTQLADAPSAYTGAANRLVRVNAGATGLVFGALASGDVPLLVIGFALGTGATGSNVATPALAPRAGSVTKCKFVTKASDPATDLTFNIKRNGTSIFSTPPTVPHGTAASAVSTFTALTSSPLSVAADDVFTLDISSGTATWQGTIQLE